MRSFASSPGGASPQQPGPAEDAFVPYDCDALRAVQVTVSGTRPAPGEPRELAVCEDALRRGRALAA